VKVPRAIRCGGVALQCHERARVAVNGKTWPDVDPVRVKKGKRYRIALKNGIEDGHPIHLHRHPFDVVKIGDIPVSGLLKYTINVSRNSLVEVDVVADHPGDSLIHCHMQQHIDYGFEALVPVMCDPRTMSELEAS
jgi:FtsP/CotA-like multicopper oxidase with cupredoxin domain